MFYIMQQPYMLNYLLVFHQTICLALDLFGALVVLLKNITPHFNLDFCLHLVLRDEYNSLRCGPDPCIYSLISVLAQRAQACKDLSTLSPIHRSTSEYILNFKCLSSPTDFNRSIRMLKVKHLFTCFAVPGIECSAP